MAIRLSLLVKVVSILLMLMCEVALSQIIVNGNTNRLRRKVDTFKCPDEQGHYPHPERCELYYGCWDHVATVFNCPGKQLFDLKYRGCNWPELTECQGRKRPDGYASPPPSHEESTAKPFDCSPDVDDAYYADPADCASYYRCVHGASYHFTCPPPLVFNEKTSRCTYREYTTCKQS